MKDLIRSMVLFMVLGITAITISCSLFGRYDAPIEDVVVNDWFVRATQYGPDNNLPDGALYIVNEYSSNSNHFVMSLKNNGRFELKTYNNGAYTSTFFANYNYYSNTVNHTNYLKMDFDLITNIDTNGYTNIIKYNTEYIIRNTIGTNEMVMRCAFTKCQFSMISNMLTNLLTTNDMFDPMYLMASNNIQMFASLLILGTTQYNNGY